MGLILAAALIAIMGLALSLQVALHDLEVVVVVVFVKDRLGISGDLYAMCKEACELLGFAHPLND